MSAKFLIQLFLCLFVSAALQAQESAISEAMKKNQEVNRHFNMPQANLDTSEEDKIQQSDKSFDLLKGWQLGMTYGLSQFKGDIQQYNHYPAYQEEADFFELRSAYSFSVYKRINPYINYQVEFITGNFAGLLRKNESSWLDQHDPYSLYEGNGEKFETDFIEFDFSINTNLNNLFSSLRESIVGREIIFYGKIGVGYNIYHSVKRNLLSDTYIYSYGYEDEENLSAENPKDWVSAPSESVYILGISGVYSLNKRINIHMEYTRRTASTDKWDSSIMSTSVKNDSYNYLAFGISYNIGRLEEKEDWISPIDGLKTDVTQLTANIEGISDDKDSDGVADAFDKSPNTPLGVAVDGSGRPLDVDMDNIPDYRDADPFSTIGSQVDENGVELDSDSDGIADSKDLESNTPRGALVNQFGMNVSIYNSNTSGLAVFPSIYFTSGSSDITVFNENRLTTVALALTNNPEIQLLVIGHTDDVGTQSANKELGMQRANAVIEQLVELYGIDINRLTPKSKGEEYPLAKPIQVKQTVEGVNFTNPFNKINRRVDFQLLD